MILFYFFSYFSKRKQTIYFTYQAQFPLPPLLPYPPFSTPPHPLLREGKEYCFEERPRPSLLYLGCARYPCKENGLQRPV